MAMQKMQSLVGAAGDWMAGDPLTTAVGAKISAATDEGLLMEDWALNMEICDIVNSYEEGPAQAIKAIKRRLQNAVGKSHKATLFTLIVMETCVKNCGKPFHLLVCQRDFANELINRVIAPNIDVSTSIQDKVLSLIQSWAHAFSPDPDLRGVAEVYMDLKRKGIEFPTPSDEDLLLVQSRQPATVGSPTRPASSASSSSSSSRGSRIKGLRSPTGSSKGVGGREVQQARVPPSGQLTEGQVRKLERDLQIAQRNMEVFNELLSELTPGEEHPEDRRLLHDVSGTCREMQARILELIGLVQHRELTASLLDLNDQMNNQLLRFERYKNNTSAERGAVKSPVSSDDAFSPDEVLTLAMPAVPAASASASALPIASIGDVPSIACAGDIPTLTRTGAAPENDFHEIEAWMAEEGGEESLLAMIGADPKQMAEAGDLDSPRNSTGTDATTEEFDRFLQKRVQAVEKKD